MKRTVNIKFLGRIVLLLLLLSGSLFHYSIKAGSAWSYYPVPSEDTYAGRNSHAYLPPVNGLTKEHRQAFVQEVAAYAEAASAKWGIPASAIIAMAVHESGYGTTRIAYHANNLFGIKQWGRQPDNAWQLKGQPLEDFGQPIAVLEDHGEDRKIYDESARVDNWYRMFASREEAVDYLAGTFLQRKRYLPAKRAYEQRLAQGWNPKEASRQYVHDIAEAGYNHLGGDTYLKRVGAIMDEWNLYQYDMRSGSGFHDAAGHWAQRSIERLAKEGIVSGFADGTFRPDEAVTREQFLKMVAMAMERDTHLDAAPAPFVDVPTDRWSSSYIASAVRRGIVRPEEHDGALGPGEPISRQEMAAYAARALELEPLAHSIRFRDQSSVESHYAEWLGAAYTEGIITGFEDGTFRPQAGSTRAQAAVVIDRMLDSLARSTSQSP